MSATDEELMTHSTSNFETLMGNFCLHGRIRSPVVNNMVIHLPSRYEQLEGTDDLNEAVIGRGHIYLIYSAI